MVTTCSQSKEGAALQGQGPTVTASLQSADGQTTHATATFSSITADWALHQAELWCNTTDDAAVLAISVSQCIAVAIDVVSLFPGVNGMRGSASPFRRDILQMLKDLKPECVP